MQVILLIEVSLFRRNINSISNLKGARNDVTWLNQPQALNISQEEK
jgi:hypothetical protein